MAKYGLEYVCYGKLSGDPANAEAAKYTEAKYLGPSSAFNGAPNASSVTDYGDDRSVETDRSVTGGTVSLELNERTLEDYSALLGHEYSESAGMTAKSDDTAPYVGIGAIGKSKRSGANVYTLKFYYKVLFGEPSDDNATKQETTAFSHTTLEGTIMQLTDGTWKHEQEYTSLAAAKSALDTLLGIAKS